MCQSVRWVTSANIMGIVSTPHAPRRPPTNVASAGEHACHGTVRVA